MKKNKDGMLGFSMLGLLLFFMTIGVTSVLSIIVYHFVNEASGGNIVAICFSVLGMISFGAFVCTLFDILRRKRMVERPAKLILEATQKIASGDFSVRLSSIHEFANYDQYDLIYQNINAMTEELSRNEVLKNDFISNVSHEIKTPLSVIQNYAKTLQNDNIDEEKKQECLKGLIEQSKRLSALISNILKLNKLENQKLIPEKDEFDLSELVRVCIIDFESLFERKKLELVCDIDDIKIVNSESLLELVFNNLISNAIKFTPEGGKITITLKDDGEYAILSVQDTGCGISKEVGQHIFEKFYQGDTSRASEGNGLGLALVKKVIDVIGGEISVESKVGVGSKFTIKLKKD